MNQNQTTETGAEVNQSEAKVHCSDLLGAGVEQPDGTVVCAACGYEAEWGECTACGGEGGHDGYEDDPNWYRPGEIVPCCQCDGGGGDWWCENRECATQQIWKITKAPNADISRPASK